MITSKHIHTLYASHRPWLNAHTILRLPVHLSNEYNCVLTVQPGQRSAAFTCCTRQGKVTVVCHGQPSKFRYHVSLVILSPGRHSRWSCANLSVSHRTETALRFQHDLIYITSISMTRWLRRRWYDCSYARVLTWTHALRSESKSPSETKSVIVRRTKLQCRIQGWVAGVA